jgi:enoyl-[acyl-carrier protein] reductase I
MGELNELAKKTGSEVIGADATSMEDLEKLFDAAVAKFGKLDFILHSIGMSVNMRKGKHYTEINYDWLEKGWDVLAVSFHKIMRVAWEKNCMNEWSSILALTFIAAQRTFPDYNDMSDNKSYLESIARTFGYYWGERKVRVNTISQSPTVTTAGSGVKGFGGFLGYADAMSPLGNATASDCADYCVVMFSDLTRKVTMQNLYHDGGFSNTGVSQKIIDRLDAEH